MTCGRSAGSVALVRPLRATAWELRGAWALGRRVSVTLEDADSQRLEGVVRSVAATGAYAVIAGTHVPLDRVLAVHRPSRLGDSTVKEGQPWGGAIPAVLRADAAQLQIRDGGLGSA